MPKEKKGKDLDTTRKACEKFSHEPTTIVNFLEGTRITPEKHARLKPDYKHLLNPKAGGIAFAIQALGGKFNTVIDATIHYDRKPPNYWDMACGRLGKVTVCLRKITIPEQFMSMDYTNNERDRAEFQAWVSELWKEKDQEMERLNQQIQPQA